MKKILSLCLAIITFISCVYVANATESVVSSEAPDFSYKLIDGEAWLTNYTGTATELTLPTTLDGYSVVGISGDRGRFSVSRRELKKPVFKPTFDIFQVNFYNILL